MIGTELIRRMGGGEAYAVTTPLIKKADGTKFGKTAGGSVWLDANKTSPYQYYQYWLNASDEDAENFIKIFTLKSKEEIDSIISEHREEPHLRLLQKALAEDITIRTHGEEALKTALAASKILFGKSTSDDLKSLSEQDFFAVFEGVPQATISRNDVSSGLGIIDALSGKTGFLASNGEARRDLKGNAISVNKEKVNDQVLITEETLINDKYVLLRKGKKNNYILIVE